MLAPGRLLADRYRLDSRIAVGGMGEVWRASDTRLDRTVAVKILKAELSDDAEFLHRFRTEARTTASLNHPGIAAVHDYGESAAEGAGGNVAYLVMELVDGEPLAGILAREGRIAPERLLPLLEQAGQALQAAHERGLVHRDVKPGNILVTRGSDGQERVKITDFGIAKAADAVPVTRNGMVMGTAHYIAPEQALGHEAEPASDVYSLAVCGYECLASHRPFLSENAVTVAMMHIRDTPPPLPHDVPPTVRALIEMTLVKDPRLRYANGGEFAAAVAAVRAGHTPPVPAGVVAAGGALGPGTHPPMHPVAVPHPAATGPMTGAFGPPPHQPGSRHVWPWVVVAAVGLALVTMAAVLLPRLLPDTQEQAPGERTPVTSAPGTQPGSAPASATTGAERPPTSTTTTAPGQSSEVPPVVPSESDEPTETTTEPGGPGYPTGYPTYPGNSNPFGFSGHPDGDRAGTPRTPDGGA